MKKYPQRLFSGMIDLHGHLLPGIDDGAKTLEQAINMARIAAEDGIAVSVLTPHHLNGVFHNPADKVRRLTRDFQRELRQAGVELDVLPGSECHLVPELPDALAAGEIMTVADHGQAVLVELPVHTIPMGATAILENILALGVTPVIVHPERNSALRHSPDRLAEWVDMGCLAQVTAQACTGRFGEAVEATARHFVRSGNIHFLASDAHRDRRRVPQLSEARRVISRWTSAEVGRLLSEEFPRAAATGRRPELGRLCEALRPKRRAWTFWRRKSLI